MDLKKFKINHNKRNLVVVSNVLLVLLLTAILIYRSYAVYQEQQGYDVIEGKVPGYNDNYDVKVALTVDGVGTTTFPEKGTKAVSSIVCDKGATGLWNYYNWNINIKNMKETRTRCQINFVTKYLKWNRSRIKGWKGSSSD